MTTEACSPKLPLMRARLLSALLACWLPVKAPACDLALALAVDVSGSVTAEEYRVQMQGLADAVRDAVISEALAKAEAAVILIHWTGSSRQEVTLPWTRVRSYEDAQAFAAAIAAAPREWSTFATALGEALEFTGQQFADVPDCKRKIIDVSGDGFSNEGPEPRSTHAELRRIGIVVNAIAIEAEVADLTTYFWENVIMGEGAFVVTANSFEDYPERMRRKLLRETTDQVSRQGVCPDKLCVLLRAPVQDGG